ncbi:uncharacterized protein LOC106158861 [Lingula anatina]|uniref:Small ribosomal subunit protein uS10m n=1 Tax=Lingula anatina TaxID=7574 RepID=A0A1S3HWL4_LINAN|nr:uncharacterized protein LOC106158861 [Lingula anatina]|eukprot:XP_013390425.1 uncharacterized protein LOC106158861 [Lingula anatina]
MAATILPRACTRISRIFGTAWFEKSILQMCAVRINQVEHTLKIKRQRFPMVHQSICSCRHYSTDTTESRDPPGAEPTSENNGSQENSERHDGISDTTEPELSETQQTNFQDAAARDQMENLETRELKTEAVSDEVSHSLGETVCEEVKQEVDFAADEETLSIGEEDRGESLKHNEPDVLYRKVAVEIKGHDKRVLKTYAAVMKTVAERLDIQIRMWNPPRVIERMTLLKSAFVHKKHRRQYEMRTHFHVVELQRVTGSTTDTYLEYIQRNIPEGIAMRVTKHQLVKLPEEISQTMES